MDLAFIKNNGREENPLTLQGCGVNEVDGARHSDTHAHLTHVPQTLRQPR